jgi:hypothetical protein
MRHTQRFVRVVRRIADIVHFVYTVRTDFFFTQEKAL